MYSTCYTVRTVYGMGYGSYESRSLRQAFLGERLNMGAKVDLSKFTDDQLKAELKKRKEKKDKEAHKARLAKPYRPGSKEVPAKKMVRCYPTCKEKDIFSTPYGADCMVCGQDWT